MTVRPVVHIVDDDDSLRGAMERLLAAAGRAVRAYASRGEFLLDPPADAPGCLLLDFACPAPRDSICRKRSSATALRCR